ncbi:MAG: alpha/beta fold hydrolase [Planctomycetaceae bacterium]|nr:alpha/beta fold hydrolase [Planctomycetaceae bacterium]
MKISCSSASPTQWVRAGSQTVLLTVMFVSAAAFADAAQQENTAAGPIRHSDLSVYLGDDGMPKPIRTEADWAIRRKLILAGMQEAMGPLADHVADQNFNVQILEDVRIEKVRRLLLNIRTQDDDQLSLDLYLPAALADTIVADKLLTQPLPDSIKKAAAIVALHPTGEAGRRIVAGEGGKAGRQYGMELAQRGYVVVAPDYPSFGNLKSYDFAADKYVSGTMKGIVNHRRCVDLLAALPFVDAEKLGVIGHSLGGHNAIFLGVVDTRLKAIVSSCGWCPFGDYYGGNITGWTSDRYMPLLKTKYELNVDKVPFDFYELVAALAPRTFVSVSPVEDSNFDINGVRKAIPVAGSVYSLLNAREKLVLLTPDCGHDFPADIRLQVYGILDRTLNHQPDAFEPDYALELPRIAPTAPADAIKTFEVIDGFEMQMMASEPLVTDPVAMAYDEDGRLFVVEMRDYSEQDKEHLGVVRVLIDTNQDGVFDDSRLFAEGLSWPTAICSAKGGIFVAAAPDVFFIKDTNGDLKADEQSVVFTGFSRNNVQGLINSFHWGPDNRIYGSASTTGGSITCPKHPDRAPVECRGRDFSFDPITLDLRPETGGGQHGMSFDDWGHRFVSANSDHAQQIVFADRYLSRFPLATAAPARASIAADGGQAPVFRISPVEPWRIVRTRLRASGLSKGIVEGGGRPAGYFTGATGITIYRGDAWDSKLKGTAIIGDVGSNIIHRKRMTPNGVLWTADRMDPGKELVASKDIWFRPVQYGNGPDGCLQIMDMYREVIEHPASLPPEIKRHLDLTSGRDRGRLYRLAPAGYTYRPTPAMSKLSAADLVPYLEHSNSWHRETARRLLFERQDKSVVPAVRMLLNTSTLAQGRFECLCCLDGLGSITEADLFAAFKDREAGVREYAIVLAEKFKASNSVLDQLITLAGDDNARVLMQLAFSLGEFPVSPARQNALTSILLKAGQDRWIRTAVLSSLGPGAADVMKQLASNSGDSAAATTILPELADAVARTIQNEAGLEPLKATITALNAQPQLQIQILQAAQNANRGLASMAGWKELTTSLVNAARSRIADSNAPAEQRAAGLRTLSLSSWSQEKEALLAGLDDSQNAAIQAAALETLVSYSDAEISAELIQRYPQMTPTISERARDAMMRRSAWTILFLDAIGQGTLPLNSVLPADLQRLADLPDDAVRSRAIKLLEKTGKSSRDDVLRAFQVALTLKGNRERGAEVFKKNCSTCHQIGTVGNQVGPNLATMKNRGPEAILTNVLDPNREVNPAWRDYLAVTVEGTTHNGVLINESAGSLTLRRAEAKETTLLRSDIEALRDTGRSLMPEGLEKSVDTQAMADLIAWIMSLE